MIYVKPKNAATFIATGVYSIMAVSPAVGEEAIFIRETEYKAPYQVFAYTEELNSALADLDDLYSECKFDGWEGEGSVGVSFDIKQTVEHFFNQLHNLNIPFPEICAEADGEISLDWIKSKKRLVSISVGENGLLSILDIDHSSKWHGSMQYSGRVSTPLEQRLKSI